MHLSPRQKQVLTLIKSGIVRDKAIARLLSISPKTSKVYVNQLMQLFGVNRRVDLVGVE